MEPELYGFKNTKEERDGENLSIPTELHYSTEKISWTLYKTLPLEFREPSFSWSVIFQAPTYFLWQPRNIRLADSRVSICGKMSICAWLSICGGVKASAVVGVEGLLQFWPSRALLASLTKLGAGLAQVSWWPKATTFHWTTMVRK